MSKETIDALKQALAAGEKFIAKVHTGKAKSTETYDDLTTSNRALREAIKREEAQTVEPVNKPLPIERETLVVALRRIASEGLADYGNTGYPNSDAIRKAADMLAADASWERVARAQNAKLLAMTDHPEGMKSCVKCSIKQRQSK